MSTVRALPEPQDLNYFNREYVEFFCPAPEDEDVDLGALAVEVQSPDGVTVLDTFTVGDGVTVVGDTGVQVKFPTAPFGSGDYQYQVWDTTVGSTVVVAWGRLGIYRTSLGPL